MAEFLKLMFVSFHFVVALWVSESQFYQLQCYHLVPCTQTTVSVSSTKAVIIRWVHAHKSKEPGTKITQTVEELLIYLCVHMKLLLVCYFCIIYFELLKCRKHKTT